MGKGYLGRDDFAELLAEVKQTDLEFCYNGERYMFSCEWIGSRKRGAMKACLSYQDGTYEEYKETLQAFDTWEDLFANAIMRDGSYLKDVLKDI